MELIDPKIRDRSANLKPGELGYQTAWDRLKAEYGQTKVVIAANFDQIINLPTVRGTGYNKVYDFYESLSKSFDALHTLGEGSMLKGLVIPMVNKLPNIKADLVRTDEKWEEWGMENLIKALQKWLKRNQPEAGKETGEKRRERHMFSQKGRGLKPTGIPTAYLSAKNHTGKTHVQCITLLRSAVDSFLSTAYASIVHGQDTEKIDAAGGACCYKCKSRHHTSLCNRESGNEMQNHNKLLNGFSPSKEEKSLPAIIPMKIQGVTFWAYLDTGSGRNFVFKEAINKLRLKPKRHDRRHILTVDGTK